MSKQNQYLDRQDTYFGTINTPLGLEQGPLPRIGGPLPSLLIPNLLDTVVGIQNPVHVCLPALLARLKACVEVCLHVHYQVYSCLSGAMQQEFNLET